MRFDDQGRSLWYGTPDAPAPGETVQAHTPAKITIGLLPPAASNRALVSYRVNGGPAHSIAAVWQRHDVSRGAQYFTAWLPAFEEGDLVEYSVTCQCGGRQLPTPEQNKAAISSFRVTGQTTRTASEPTVDVPSGEVLAVNRVVMTPATAMNGASSGASPSRVIASAPAPLPVKPVLATPLAVSPPPVLKQGSPGPTPTIASPADHVEGSELTSPSPGAVEVIHGIGGASAFGSPSSGSPATVPIDARLKPALTLLATSPALANAQVRAGFASRFSNFKGSIDDFWTVMSQDQEFKDLVPEIQFTLQLGALTLNNAALLTALRAKFQPKSPRDLTRLSPSDWAQLISDSNASVPDGIPGETPSDRVRNYVNNILRSLKAAFPSDYISRGLAQLASTTQNPTDLGVSQFLKNSPDFNLAAISVDTYISKNAATALQNIPSSQQAAIISELKTYRRMSRISIDFQVINTLKQAGLHSAYSITMMPQSAFVEKFGNQLGGGLQATAIHARARHITASALHLYASVRLALGSNSVRVIGDIASGVKETLDGSGIANWEALFGSLSYCACEDCRSVLSAAAYFVDLLQFLDKSGKNAAGRSPLDVLLARRPDLPYIKLNCENTNASLPYVDLVNEVLESYVALGGKLEATTAKNTQSDATPDELSVNPQYSNDDAYAVLQSAFYPQTLPFEKSLESARIYLEFLGSSLYEVMSTFQLGGDPLDAIKGLPSGLALACEYLKISEAEYVVLTRVDFSDKGPSPARSLFQYYGYAGPTASSGDTWQQEASQAPQFLHRTGIGYTDLVALLETRFLNPTQSITLMASESDPCNLALTQIVDASASTRVPQDATLDRLHRFIRLWKKLGWAISDLDKAMRAVGATDIDMSLLVSLAQMKQLQAILNLQPNQLLTFWVNIDTDGRDSLYSRLFQNKAVVNPVDPAFALRYVAPLPSLPSGLRFPANISYDSITHELQFTGTMTDDERAALGQLSQDETFQLALDNLFSMRWFSGTDMIETNASIKDHQNTILGALRISPDELTAIGAATGLYDTTVTPAAWANLSLENLSILYRHALLASALNLSVNDLISLITLTGASPFRSAGETLSFAQRAQRLQSSSFSVAQLNYLYRDLYEQTSGVAPMPANVTLLLTNLQSGLAKIARESAPRPDPRGEVLRRKLGTILGSSMADAAMGVINGTGVYFAPLPSLPDSVAAFLEIPVSYDDRGQQLLFAGVMSDSQRSALLGLTSDAGYQTAVNNLFTASQGAESGASSVALATLPSSVVLPNSLKPRLSYDSIGQQLRFTGPMTDAWQAGVLQLSADASYQRAVASLYRQPRDFISLNLAGFLSPADAAHLIENPDGLDTAEKIDYVMRKLMPYLWQISSQSFVKQVLSDNLQLDPKTTDLLLTTVLNSQTGPTATKAMADFQALAGDGLSAEYFQNQSLADAPSLTRIDPMVDFSWGSGSPHRSIQPAAFSVRWSGYLLPQYTETYTFYARVGDGVRLWVNDDLIIDEWRDQPPTDYSGKIELAAGQLYDIKLEYYSHTASAVAKLSWSSPSTPKATIPQSTLYSGAIFRSLTPIINSYTLLFKVSSLVNTFAMTSDDVTYLSAHGIDFANLDLNSLPIDRAVDPAGTDIKAAALFAQWERLNSLFSLRNSLAGGDSGLLGVFAAASAASSSSGRNTLSESTAQAVARASGWDQGEIASLTGPDGFNLNDADFANEIGTTGEGLVRLQSCVALVKRLGVPSRQLFSWARLGSALRQEPAVAEDIKNTVKAKYNEATWPAVGKALNDKLRQTSKSALVDYILTMPGIMSQGITDSNQLYEYFLIDVDMSACMMTSRIVQANAAIQLFVQRCLINLENRDDSTDLSVRPSAIDVIQWEWRKNYRVWQANREVFLYPENWIEPELRDNKTPFFKELEAELLQADMTPENVEQAFMNYLQKLDRVSRLDIRGTVFENDTDPATGAQINVLHVFGRTLAAPHIYYYRKLDLNTSVWTGWEEMNVDIEGDQLIPAIWNGRLYIFWLNLSDKTDPAANQSGGQPVTYTEARLAWSRYVHGGWSPKQVSLDSQALRLDLLPFQLVFEAQVDGDGLAVLCLETLKEMTLTQGPSAGKSVAVSNLHGKFRFTGCQGIMRVEPPDGSSISYSGGVIFERSTSLSYFPVDESAQATEVLKILPSDPGLVFDHISPYDFTEPFFFQDDLRTYFIRPVAPGYQTQVLLNPGRINPVFGGSLSVGNSATGSISAGNLATLPSGAIGPGAGHSLTATAAAIAGSSPLQPAAGAILAGAAQAGTAAIATPAVSSDRAISTGISTTASAINQIYTQPSVTDLRFEIHYHPHVCSFMKAINQYGVPGLLTLASQSLVEGGTAFEFSGIRQEQPILKTAGGVFGGVNLTQGTSLFEQEYGPTDQVQQPYPAGEVDFTYGGAYSIYNWELFFHIPLLIATRLSHNQKFEDARRWFHYIFNPISNSSDPIPQRYWNLLPFYQCSVNDEVSGQIKDILSEGDAGGSSAGPSDCAQNVSSQVRQWEENPFEPHLIARMRTVAYRMQMVMKYLDNLIAWGDYLFSQTTRESINEATQIYMLAQDILGPRPVQIPPRARMHDYTYNDLVALPAGLDDLSNALVQMENEFPFSADLTSSAGGSFGLSPITSTATTSFYFCIPANDQLSKYWDTVGDRLFKIRHCMNIGGMVEQLPLFAPPISPALLVQATAMGIDLNSVLSDINSAAPNYRFNYLLQKALEICGEVRSLGASLLAALEKKDAEALAALRAGQETRMLKAVLDIKNKQIEEANDAKAALDQSREVVSFRQNYYQTLLSQGLNDQEKDNLEQLLEAHAWQDRASESELILKIVDVLAPQLTVTFAGVCSGTSLSYGLQNLNAAGEAYSRYVNYLASGHTFNGTLASIMAGHNRRQDEWTFQMSLAGKELAQIDKQISAATLRIMIAQQEVDNAKAQIEDAQAIEDFLRNKFTNEDLYNWMATQISTVFFQCYQMAYEAGKRAERGFQFERGLTESEYVQFGYWDSLKKGLLAGERLYLDLKHMEMAYLDLNTREYEISKYISLVILDPLALIALKESGHCLVNLPEALFDMDYPGHYMRRLRSVGLTIPCVAGPYTGVNCTLTLLNSRIRVDSAAGSTQDYASDSHFITNYAATQSIATSSAQNDSGMFEVNFRDERYLPFEYAGVISTWQIDLPPENNAFDLETISDLIINLKYTARDGGNSLAMWAKQAAVMPAFPVQAGPAGDQVLFPPQANLARLFSLKHEFPADWYKFLNPIDTATSQGMQVGFTIERFPFQYRGRRIQVSSIELILKFKDIHDPKTYAHGGTPLGDYVSGGAPLKIWLDPPAGPAVSGTLNSAPTFLGGLPLAVIPLRSINPAPGLGSWSLSVQNTDIQKMAPTLQNVVLSGGNTFQHLNQAVIGDILMVCHYSAT
jgi:hypothetical protein